MLGGEENLAVDLGRIGVASAVMRLGNRIKALAEDGQTLAELLAVKLVGNTELRVHYNVVPILLCLLVDLIGKAVRGSVLLAGVRERAEAVKPRFLNVRAQLLEFRLRLAWEADDGGGADDYAGYLTAQTRYRVADNGAAAVAVHPTENVLGDVLYRNIDVLADTVVVAYLRYQLVGYLVRIEIEQPYPRDGGLLGQLTQQTREAVFAVQILTVTRGVLRNENKLLGAERLEILCLRDNVLNRTGAEAPAQGWYDAVGAAVVAALGYLEVGVKIRCGDNTVAAECERLERANGDIPAVPVLLDTVLTAGVTAAAVTSGGACGAAAGAAVYICGRGSVASGLTGCIARILGLDRCVAVNYVVVTCADPVSRALVDRLDGGTMSCMLPVPSTASISGISLSS